MCVCECARMCVLMHVTCVLVTVMCVSSSRCLIVQVFSFSIVKLKKIGARFFTIFSLPETHTGSLSGYKTTFKTN